MGIRDRHCWCVWRGTGVVPTAPRLDPRQSSNDNESITAVTDTDIFYVEVWGFSGSVAPYTLDVIEDCSAVEVCDDDSYEGG